MKNESVGKDAFETYYHKWFGDETKQMLKGLRAVYPPVLLVDPKNDSLFKQFWRSANLQPTPLPWFPLAYRWPEKVSLGEVLPGFREKLFYPMSLSSLLPVMALSITPQDRVLDVCAAPGGKALAIGHILNDDSRIMANDLSLARATAMKHVFMDYNHPQIRTMIGPAETLYKRIPQRFTKILVDAPCSSEQHVYNSPKHLASWSYKRVADLSKRQVELVLQTAKLLEPGGKLIYSTCAITPEENELVVEEILHASPTLSLISLDLPIESAQLSLSVSYDLKNIVRVMPHTQHVDPMFVTAFRFDPDSDSY